jgi:MFS family permease
MAELDVSYPGLALVILTPALCSFMYGVDLGVTSFVLSMLRDPVAGSEDVWWRGMASEHILQGLFVSGLSLGALIGSHILLVYLAQFIGRRTEIRAAACLYMLGTLLNVASGTLLRNSPTWMGFSCLLVGRLVFGCGVGFVQHGACMYMSEMCPASIRGAVVTAKEAFIVIGIIVGYSIGDHFSRDPLKWAGTLTVDTGTSFSLKLSAFSSC